jgi:hypothetical protein
MLGGIRPVQGMHVAATDLRPRPGNRAGLSSAGGRLEAFLGPPVADCPQARAGDRLSMRPRAEGAGYFLTISFPFMNGWISQMYE